jgi:transposase-like protein
MVERGGSVETYTVPNVRRETIMPFVDANVARTASVYTDEMHAYKALPAMGYSHSTVPHAEKIYVLGNVHTNTIEGFWSLVKNGIRGVYHAVSSKYLQSYLDEYTFRYNNRKSITPMFDLFLRRILATQKVAKQAD